MWGMLKAWWSKSNQVLLNFVCSIIYFLGLGLAKATAPILSQEKRRAEWKTPDPQHLTIADFQQQS